MYVYERGDLHPPFWERVVAHAVRTDDEVRFDGLVSKVPCFERALAATIASAPGPAYLRLSLYMLDVVPQGRSDPSHHVRMELARPEHLPDARADRLGHERSVLRRGIPGQLVRCSRQTPTVSCGTAAGMRVVAPGATARGNVAVHPAHRGRGFARQVTAALCHDLLGRLGAGATIGLDVHADNVAARRCTPASASASWRCTWIARCPDELARISLGADERNPAMGYERAVFVVSRRGPFVSWA